jgi:hypothetical protein
LGVLRGVLKPENVPEVVRGTDGRLALDAEAGELLGLGRVREIKGEQRFEIADVSFNGE